MSFEHASRYVLGASWFMTSAVFGAVEVTDFIDDTEGSVSRWDVSETELDGNGRKFPDGGEAITSPVYGGSAIRVSVSARMFGQNIAGSGSALKIEARTSAADGWEEIGGIVFSGGSATNGTFSVLRSEDFRQFRLSFIKGNGTLRVSSFSVTWRAEGEVAVPFSPGTSEVGDRSFDAVWMIDETVDSFLFDCWKVSMTRWTGDVKWSEGFDACENTGGSAKDITDGLDEHTGNPGWGGEYLYIPAGHTGVIQVNKASGSVGWLVSPELPEMKEVELVVRAKAYAEQPDHVMPVYLIRGGVTNDLAAFELGTAFSDHNCTIGDVLEGDRIAFKSFSVGSQRRVVIDGIFLVSGFSPGRPETNAVCESAIVEYSESPEYHVEGLSPGTEYAFSVRAVSGGSVSAASEVRTVVTELSGETEDASGWSGVTASDITHTSFAISWPYVSGAEKYRVSVWTNVLEGAADGSVVWSESFSKSMGTTSTTAIKNDDVFCENHADSAGWTIISNVYPSVDGGAVRLGNTSNPGGLAAPFVRIAAGKTLRVLARRQTEKEGAIFSVWIDSGGKLAEVGEAQEMSETGSWFTWTLPELGAEDRLVFRSVSGKPSYRTILDEIMILDGYREGVLVPDVVADAELLDAAYGVSGLATAVWSYAVEAVDADGTVLAAATNTVDLVNPPPQPVLAAVPLSESERRGGLRIWKEDFSAFASVFPSDGNTADWLNGVTLAYWQSYYGGTASDGITRNNGAKTSKGLYAYWATNKVTDTYALGVMTTGTAEEQVFGLAFLNDTDFPARKVSVKYDCVQFGFRNLQEQELVFEYLATNELVSAAASGNWMACEALAGKTVRDNVSGLVSGEDLPVAATVSAEIPGLRVPRDGYLVIRWRRAPVSNAAAMGVDDLEVAFEVQSRPLTIVIR